MNEPTPTEKRFLESSRKLLYIWDKWPWIANAVAAIAALLVGAATAIDSIPSWNILTAIWLFGILATVGLMLIANRGASKRATRTLDLETRIKLLEKSTKAAEAAMDEFKSNNLQDLHSTARALIWVLNLD